MHPGSELYMSGFYVDDIPLIQAEAERNGLQFVHHQEKKSLGSSKVQTLALTHPVAQPLYLCNLRNLCSTMKHRLIHIYTIKQQTRKHLTLPYSFYNFIVSPIGC